MDTQKYNQIVNNVMKGFYTSHDKGQDLLEMDLKDLMRYFETQNEALEKEVEKLEDKIDVLEDEINELEDDLEEYGIDYEPFQRKKGFV
jgi:chromosome segregation ATPase